MKVLLTAFEGNNNSSKILVNKLDEDGCDKLILSNSYEKSVLQLNNQLKNKYDLILSFGQKPVIKDKIYIETTGKNPQHQYTTTLDYFLLQSFIQTKGYPAKISSNAGTSFCNYIYCYTLEKIEVENLTTKIIFIHIPCKKNINDIEKMALLFTDYIKTCLCKYS